MADSTSPVASLSARFGEWFKAQPEAQTYNLQASDHTHSNQPSEAATVHGVKGPNERFTPILYDFDSKYAIEDPDSFIDGENSKGSAALDSPTTAHLHMTENVPINDTNAKARKVLGLDHKPGKAPPKFSVSHAECTSPCPSSPAQKSSIQPAITPPTPTIFLLPNKKPWTKTHIRTLIILSSVLQAGIIAITVSIVLYTQSTTSRRTTDGSIITGVVGCASILCGLITGYDMLIAEYSPSQHSHCLAHPSAPDIEKGFPISSVPATKSLITKFSNKELSIDIHAANAGRYHITHHQLPHNVMYNSRLSSSFPHPNPPASPYATSITSQYANAPTSPRFPPLTSQFATSITSPRTTFLASPSVPLASPRTTPLASPRTRTFRRLTPHSPLPYSPIRGSAVPLPSPKHSSTPTLAAAAPPDSWAQKLESRVRPLSKSSALQRLSTLPEEEDEGKLEEGKEGKDDKGENEKEGGKGKEGNGGKKEGGRDSTTSHILSLYGDGLRSWPASPAAGRSTFELSAYKTPVSTPRRGSFFRRSGGMGEAEGGRRGSVEGMWGRYTPQL